MARECVAHRPELAWISLHDKRGSKLSYDCRRPRLWRPARDDNHDLTLCWLHRNGPRLSADTLRPALLQHQPACADDEQRKVGEPTVDSATAPTAPGCEGADGNHDHARDRAQGRRGPWR